MKKIVIFIIFLLAGCLVFGYFGFLGPGGGIELERFIVNPDTPQNEIIDNLSGKKLFKNRRVFEFFLSRHQKEISPGAYLVSGTMNAYKLAKVLTSTPYQKWVVIPPAKRKEQVALILKRALDWTNEQTVEFIKIAQEGWLFSDTYLINTDYNVQQTYEKLFNAFNEKLGEELSKILLEKNIRLDTAVKFASLIEREYGSEEDRKIISAVIWNRLDIGMRLEIDATVQYALATQKCLPADLENCDFWPRLASGQTRSINSPYSTYKNKGLPSGPICSPSMASIWAAAEPAETKALYYLHSSDGQIHPADTYTEHLANIRKYLN